MRRIEEDGVSVGFDVSFSRYDDDDEDDVEESEQETGDTDDEDGDDHCGSRWLAVLLLAAMPSMPGPQRRCC